MKISVLASGSKGNCYQLHGVGSSLLIEAGIGKKALLEGLGHDVSRVSACFISHEHGDHSKSAVEMAKLGIDVYASKGTLTALNMSGHRANALEPLKLVHTGDFSAMPFGVEHDAAEPMGFLIRSNALQERVLFVTDTYYCRYKFHAVHCVMVEANYSEEILSKCVENGWTDPIMAKRVRRSHFEIGSVIDFLKASDLSRTKLIVLMHLSDGHSNADQFIRMVEAAVGIKTVVAEAGHEYEF